MAADTRYISLDGPPLGGMPPQEFINMQHHMSCLGYHFGPPDPNQPVDQITITQSMTARIPQAAAPAPTTAPPASAEAAAVASPPPPPAAAPTAAPAPAASAANPAHPTVPPPSGPPGPPSAAPSGPNHTCRLPTGAFPPSSNNPFVSASGQGYIFPEKHTTIHIIEAYAAPWDNPGGTFQWRSYSVPSILSVAELIDRLCPEHAPDGRKVVGRGITECIEVGGGAWLKGAEFWIGGRRGDTEEMRTRVSRSLAGVGWTHHRGQESPPVWITMLISFA